MKFFLYFICVSSLSSLCAESLKGDSVVSSGSQMFSLSTEEMVFASKLSDENRHRFCYKFSFKERNLAMLGGDVNLSPNENVERVFSSLCTPLESKVQAR